MATFTGNEQDNLLNGTEEADQISGLQGNDTLQGFGGDDVILGGAGNDRIVAGAGNDLARGGDGNDFMQGNEGNDVLFGGAGDDRIYGGPGDDFVSGGLGNDLLCSGIGSADLVTAGAGDDRVIFYRGTGQQDAADQNNVLIGGSGVDTLDVLRASYFGSAENAATTIFDMENFAVIFRETDGDAVVAEQNAALFYGFEKILVRGGSAIDYRGAFQDMDVQGTDNADTFRGGSGDEIFRGGGGDDLFSGGGGTDVFASEADDADTFEFRATDGTITVSGFNGAGEDGGDLIRIFADDPNDLQVTEAGGTTTLRLARDDGSFATMEIGVLGLQAQEDYVLVGL